MRKYVFWAIMMGIGIITVLAGYFLGKTGEIRFAYAAYAQMSPTVADDGGVDVNSAFTISFENPVSAAQVRNFLLVEPFLELGVHQGKNNQEVLVVPAEPLSAGTVYRFTLNAEGEKLGFAFQTKAPLEIGEVFPRDKSLDTPLNTPISITFNTANNANCQPYFKIEPEVEGSFEFAGRTVSFIPHKPLAPETVYTVTALKGWPLSGSSLALEDEYQFQFETVSQNGEKGRQLKLSMAGQSFLPGEVPFFRVDNAYSGWAKVRVYAYDSPNSYGEAILKNLQSLPGWSRKAANSSLEDFASLIKLVDEELPLIKGEDCHYLVFPEELPLGNYVLDVDFDGIRRQLHFQVSAIRAFVQPGDEETLIWLKDVISGESVEGGRVKELNRGDSASIKEDGIVIMKGIPPQGYAVYFIESQNRTLVLSQRSGLSQNAEASQGLEVYLYSDRFNYQNNDTLKFWGVIKAPQELDLSLLKLNMGLYGHIEQGEAIFESPIELKGNAFSGEFDLRNFNNGRYSLGLSQGDEMLSRREFLVEEPYTPHYELKITPHQKAVYSGEDLIFNLSVKDFENRPVSGLRLEYKLSAGAKGYVNTDRNGQARLVLSSLGYNQGSDQVSGLNPMELKTLTVSTITPNGMLLEAAASAIVFKTPVVVDGRVDFQKGKGFFEWEISSADTRSFNLSSANSAKELDFKGQLLPDQKIGVEIYRLEIKGKPGATQSRDPQLFSYEEDRVRVAKTELITDGQGRISLELDLPENLQHNYKYLIRLKALQGQEFNLDYYVYPWLNNSSDAYQILPDKPGGYAQGGEFAAVFSSAGKSVLSGDFLFYIQKAPGRMYKVGQSPEYTGVFQKEDYPYLIINGVYFDGSNFRVAESGVIKGRNSLSELNISILPAKALYNPGENGSVKLKVTDGNNLPVAATLHLRIASAAALAGDDSQEFSQVFSPWNTKTDLPKYFLSHEAWQPSLKEQKLQAYAPIYTGESANTQVPLFVEAATDSSGEINLEFTAPAQAGIYTITCLALNDSYETGEAKSFFVTESPFALEIMANSHYISEDTPTIFLKNFGELAYGEVNYELLLEGPGKNREFQILGEAQTGTAIDLGRLAPGDYRITAQALSSSGGQAKASHRFEVKEDFIYIPHGGSAPLAQDKVQVKGGSGPSLVIVSAPLRSKVLLDLWQAAGDISPRLENRIAAASAQKLLKDYWGDELDVLSLAGNDDLRSYQNHDGGAASLPGMDSDLELSVKAAALGSYQFANEELVNYFSSHAQKSQDVKTYALSLAGLAALDKPVLNEIKVLLNKETLSFEERLYLLWGLAVAGDSQNASRQLDILWEEGGEGGKLCPEKANLSPSESYNCNLWAMMVSALCGTSEQWETSRRQVLSSIGKNNPCSIEMVLASRAVLPRLKNDEISFSYSLGNEGEKISLPKREDFRLLVMPDKLASLRFKNIKGSPTITWLYKKALSNEVVIGRGAELSRYYSITSGGGEELEAGVMKIKMDYSLDESMAEGWYFISDCLPGGLAPFEKSFLGSWQVGERPWLFSLGQQVVSFMVYKEEGQKLEGSYVYYAKVVSAGRFTARPAIITYGLNNKIVARAEEKIIRIK